VIAANKRFFSNLRTPHLDKERPASVTERIGPKAVELELPMFFVEAAAPLTAVPTPGMRDTAALSALPAMAMLGTPAAPAKCSRIAGAHTDRPDDHLLGRVGCVSALKNGSGAISMQRS